MVELIGSGLGAVAGIWTGIISLAALMVGHLVTVTWTIARWKGALDNTVAAMGKLEGSIQQLHTDVKQLHDDIMRHSGETAVLTQRVSSLERRTT